MSRTSFAQINLKIMGKAPIDLREYLYYLYTNHYNLFRKENKTEEEWQKLRNKYPDVDILRRKNAYYNACFDKYNVRIKRNIEIEKEYDLDIKIIAVPHYTEDIDIFLKSISKYIYSIEQTIGYCHSSDFNEHSYYYYYDDDFNIRKHYIQYNNNDEIVCHSIHLKENIKEKK